MLHVENVSKRLQQFWLQDITFSLPKGYIMGLVGPNGSGKTTLLYVLLGLFQAEQGHFNVNGYGEEQENEYKNNIGFVLNEDIFLPGISLLKNADYFGNFYSGYRRERFQELCNRFQLQPEKKLKKFSKGEKLKFQFAFALSHDPKLLLLDEPTANFDPEFREEFISIITRFVSDGEHSVLMATHLTDELDQIADYITFLYQGKLLFSKDKESMYNSYRLVSGEDYKINLIKKEKLIYKEKGTYASKALVYHTKRSQYDRELSVEIPSIEDIMYFLLKGKG